MRVRWVIVLLLSLTACSKQEPGPVVQTARFAAYAISHDGRSGAYTLDGLSQAAADESALEKCRRAAKDKAEPCEVMGRMTQGCMAEAAGSNTQHTVSVGKGNSAPRACANAVEACTANRGINCKAVTFGCMDGSPVSFCRLSEQQSAPPSPAATAPDNNSTARRKGPFGAIAVGRDGNRAGTSFAHATRADAEAAAEETCRGTGKNGAYGTGWNNSPAGACRWAVSTCRKNGGIQCEGTMYSCSPRDEWGYCDGTFKAIH